MVVGGVMVVRVVRVCVCMYESGTGINCDDGK